MSRKQRDQIMGHATDNDGIEEYDNPLPDWWVGMFIFTIIFGIGYTIEYHFISGRSQEGAYLAQMADAEKRWPSTGMASWSSDPADIEEGKALYAANCMACHGEQLEGKIGPNLKDKIWIHGGTPEEMIATITNGVGAKGMPAWESILGSTKIGKVASYIVAQGGTLKPGEKAEAAPVVEVGGADEAAEPPKPEGPELAAFEVAELTPDLIAAGEAVFTTNCVSCHKADMTGLVGPNLVDDTWMHGGELGDIYRTVTYGVPAKGMVPWEPTLGDEKVRQVVGYVYSKSHPEAGQ